MKFFFRKFKQFFFRNSNLTIFWNKFWNPPMFQRQKIHHQPFTIKLKWIYHKPVLIFSRWSYENNNLKSDKGIFQFQTALHPSFERDGFLTGMFWNKWLLRKWKISLSIFGASGNGRVLDSDEWRYLCLYANGKMLTDNLSISLLQSPDVQIFYDYQTSITWAMGSTNFARYLIY